MSKRETDREKGVGRREHMAEMGYKGMRRWGLLERDPELGRRQTDHRHASINVLPSALD